MPEERSIRLLSERREFLLAALSAAVTAPIRAAFCADDLCILPQNDIGRLKADFNANLTKVRLLFMLSPT